jgi:hypothetical protein
MLQGLSASGAGAAEAIWAAAGNPNLAVGLITTRDAHERRMIEAAGLAAHVVEVIATIENVGDALAG